MNTVIMLIFMFVFAFIVIWGVRSKNKSEPLFDKQDTLFLKGFWSIIIILVHIPAIYQNRVQDLIGSFAYIGVSFFFLSSAYGLKYNSNNNKNYLDNFFKKRIVKLILPMMFINILIILFEFLFIKNYSFGIDSIFNAWVVRLLFVYVIFWLAHKFIFKNDEKKADLMISFIIIIYSLLGYFPYFKNVCRWNVEIIGFVFGLLLYNNQKLIKNSKSKMISTTIISIFVGLLYIKFKNIPFMGDYLLRIVLSFMFNYLSMIILRKFKFGNKFSYYIGKISYEIYLCHPGIILIIKNLFPKTNSSTFIILCVFISIVFSLFSNYIIEKITRIIQKKGK